MVLAQDANSTRLHDSCAAWTGAGAVLPSADGSLAQADPSGDDAANPGPLAHDPLLRKPREIQKAMRKVADWQLRSGRKTSSVRTGPMRRCMTGCWPRRAPPAFRVIAMPCFISPSDRLEAGSALPMQTMRLLRSRTSNSTWTT